SLGFWGRRLAAAGREVDGPRHGLGVGGPGGGVLRFTDPDGLALELVEGTAAGRAPEPCASPVPPEHALLGLCGVTLAVRRGEATAAFLTGVLGLGPGAHGPDGRDMETTVPSRRFLMPGDHEAAGTTLFRDRAGVDDAGEFVDVTEDAGAPAGTMGAGTVHHVAFRVADEGAQQDFRDRLIGARMAASPVIERTYFRSIYFREPGGVLFEIATDGPGFTADEPAGALGTALRLPPQHEPARALIEAALPRLRLPR
ncbi:MAG TPA: VOC family protein, partial [Phycisphaerales bacterium]|nr:VOC family protein [Phycisphaerales bacterium]